ncbi:MAG: MerR family transcriptional regulator [Candidatus Marinimicrobia bacterium]|nr:MerR family transcriptional regulator [Candidatus Neomarinimicrobiota bacterium]
MTTDVKKLYYSIGEVSEITGLKSYVLRYWETEFPNLAPAKNRAGNRIYTEKNISIILDIKRLLYEERFTIEGARQHFKSRQSDNDGASNSLASASAIRKHEMARNTLKNVQQSLAELLDYIRQQK